MVGIGNSNRLAAIVVGLVVGFAASAGAGVVMVQDATKPDPSGSNKTESHKTLIDGNRLKT